MQNAAFDEFNPEKYTLDWALKAGKLQPPTNGCFRDCRRKSKSTLRKLESCEFNAAVAVLDDFVIETLSRLYVPMIRKELWTDDPETVERRQTIYALLHHTLKTVTLLFNPITPYLSEALYQKVYRNLNPTCLNPSTLQLGQHQTKLRNKTLEEQFDTLLKAVSISYAARQQGKLKRRWPLAKAIVVAPQKTLDALKP